MEDSAPVAATDELRVASEVEWNLSLQPAIREAASLSRTYSTSGSIVKWRHTSFRFATPKGVEDLTIVAPKEAFDAARVKSMVDSIRPKTP